MKNSVLDKFKTFLPHEAVLDTDEATRCYATNTIGYERLLLGAVIPQSSDQIPAILSIANELKVALYPLSTGKNWGYGSALPVSQLCVILDLSRLNKIIELNSQLGYVTVEPGVTQADLHEYLESRNLPLMVPTTGAGPTVSVLGNALEKGFGITPIEDHSLSLLRVRAYLADGSLYESQLHDFGGFRSDKVFKWKIGPVLDSLFHQSNLGVVFQVTIALAQRPAHVSQFISFISDDRLEEAINAVRQLRSQLGSITGGINIMNRRRLLAMVGELNSWSTQSAASEIFIRKLAEKQKLSHWLVLGGLYGSEQVVGASQKVIHAEFRKISNKTIFLSQKRVRLLSSISRILPFPNLKKMSRGLENSLRILQGAPSEIALQLAYLKNSQRPTAGLPSMSPDRDNCGLIWFSPLLPIDGHLVRDFVHEVHRICLFHNIDPLVTLTSITERCFDSTIPILYDKTNAEASQQAQMCIQSLIQMSQEFGVFPYRLDIRSMPHLYRSHHGVAARLWKGFKSHIDPHGILAPGRYEDFSE